MGKVLCTRVTNEPDVERLVEKFYEVLEAACRRSFRSSRDTKEKSTHKTVPWWSGELTIVMKRLNALRRRHQRTKGNEELRCKRTAQYTDTKTKYAAKIKKEKHLSWKEYCNMTPYTSPWNEIYMLVAGKRKSTAQITTLRKPDGSLTAHLHETLKDMLEYFVPDDNKKDDSDFHKQARILSQDPIDTSDDKELTVEELRNAVASMRDKKKAPGDGITGEIYKSTLKILPSYIIALYNGCLRFPTRWKRARVIPIVKPGKNTSDDVSKFRPISLLNVGGKVLEKVLINRINHHAISHPFLNTHQYGFRPQKSTVDAAMEVKIFVKKGLAAEVQLS